MAAALVSSALAASTNTTDATTSAINTTGATLIVIVITSYSPGQPPTVSDSKGNTWTARTSYSDSVTYSRVRIYYCSSPSVGSGHTFTAGNGGTAAYPVISVAAFSGTLLASPYDTENGTSAPSTIATLATGSVTPATDGSVLICGLTTNAGPGTTTINNGFTLLGSSNWTISQHLGHASGYLIQTTAAAVNPAFSWGTASNSAAATVAVFKPAVVSAGVLISQLKRGLCRGLGRGFRR